MNTNKRQDNDVGSSSSKRETNEKRFFVLECCGRVAMAGLDYFIQLADGTAVKDHDEHSTTNAKIPRASSVLPIPADALLHIRQSLRDILDATMQYLLLDVFLPLLSLSSSSSQVAFDGIQSGTFDSCTNKVNELVCRIFSVVLTEFIPDLMVSSTTAAVTSTATSSDDHQQNRQQQEQQQQQDTLSSTLQAVHSVLLLIQFMDQQQHQLQETNNTNVTITRARDSRSPSSFQNDIIFDAVLGYYLLQH